MRVDDIPKAWRSALAKIQSVLPGAVIAGGALRDLDNGRPVKDIDVFYEGARADDLGRAHRLLETAGFSVSQIDDRNMYPLGELNDLVGFFDFAAPEIDVPLQMIVADYRGQSLVERFDFGICRIVYDGTQIIEPEEYAADKAAKVFRLRRERADIEMVASVHRFARLSRKYEDWRFGLFEASPDDSWDLF